MGRRHLQLDAALAVDTPIVCEATIRRGDQPQSDQSDYQINQPRGLSATRRCLTPLFIITPRIGAMIIYRWNRGFIIPVAINYSAQDPILSRFVQNMLESVVFSYVMHFDFPVI